MSDKYLILLLREQGFTRYRAKTMVTIYNQYVDIYGFRNLDRYNDIYDGIIPLLRLFDFSKQSPVYGQLILSRKHIVSRHTFHYSP